MTSHYDKTEKLSGSLEAEIDRLQEMIRSPKMRMLRENARNSGQPPVRIRNAATIILIDGEPGNFKILMGQRSKKLRFMPGALVFPGGAVDRTDGAIASVDALDETTSKRIKDHLPARASARASHALPIACTRELAEETGLLIGRKSDNPPKNKNWHFFADQQMAPAINNFRLLARAITPPGAPRRFDTWFFTAPANAVGYTPEGGFNPSGELENLQWISPEDAIAANTREITRVILVELINRLKVDPELDPQYPAPRYFFARNYFNREIME